MAERSVRVGELVVDEWCNTLEDIEVFVAAGAADVIHVKMPDLGGINNTVEALLLACDAGSTPIAAAPGRDGPLGPGNRPCCDGLGADQVLAKPGMGVDEGLMIVGNEMARTAALVRAREAARHAGV